MAPVLVADQSPLPVEDSVSPQAVEVSSGSTFLDVAIALSHSRLGARLCRAVIDGLKAAAAAFPSGFTWGTACSGTDVLLKVCSHSSAFWSSQYDVDLKFESTFACEKDEDAQAFLCDQHELRRLFGDVSDLTRHQTRNLITDQDEIAPFVDGFAMGFTCGPRSPANPRAKQNMNCIQRDTSAATNVTLRGGMACIEKARPALVWLENVKELFANDGSSDQSDGEAVLQMLKDLNYECEGFVFDAAAYGSWPPRNRLYIIGLLGLSPENRSKLKMVRRILGAMEIGPGTADEVVVSDPSRLPGAAAHREGPGAPSKKKPKVEKNGEFNYKVEHMDIFGVCKLSWPPSLESSGATGDDIDFSGMSVRMAEAVDINESLKRLTGFDGEGSEGSDLKSPWKYPSIGTLTAHSRWLLRMPGNKLRLMTGFECLRAIGWDFEDWTPHSCEMAARSELGCELAGMAFSGFACAPLLAAVFAAMGMPSHYLDMTDADAQQQEEDQEVHTVESDSENSD
ncbi:unnamed protein product [Prorocentrum cordatum]|uniref:DNA (cytosine-5-)-methyltransferase n=1 Tax=Prorocentrum cordatum TaxID=2364126 RepID=A0ABN9Q7L6_9DINO|nr:unnamed protein product [Polarella glacialis]